LSQEQGTNTIYIGRLVGLALLLVVLFSTFRLVNTTAGPKLAVLAVGLLALHPQLLFIATSMSNDVASVAASAVILWWVARLMKIGFSLRGALIYGVLVGLGLLCKVHVLLTAGMLPFLMWRYRALSRKQLMTNVIVFAVGMLVVSGPWMLRNYRLVGDPLALDPVLLTGTENRSPLAYIFKPLPDFWKSFWLDFSPGLAGYAPDVVYLLISVVMILVVIGLGIIFVTRSELRLTIVMHLSLIVVTVGLSIWQKARMYANGSLDTSVAEGRHVFIILPSLALLMALSVRAIAPFRAKIGGVIVIVALGTG